MAQFNRKMKMADLVERDFHLLGLLARFGIEQRFGDSSVETICQEADVDADTFLLLCEIYASADFRPTMEMLRACRIQDILHYLNQSHDYYVNRSLVDLANALEDLVEPCTPTQKQVIHRFFADYRTELQRHFDYEERAVIPYVRNLLVGNRNTSFTIDRFEENHTQIHETLSDLKNLIMKSLPDACSNEKRISVLLSIYNLQQDLDHHTCIEDDVLVPMVRMLESPGRYSSDYTSIQQDAQREELSAREKEILVSVAQGLLNKEIADRHNISINTVITHRKNITRKIGIKTVAGLTAYAILNNLIDINSIE
ncbi:MAG: helix-turn-helix transcriptional regulator [Bacteroidales bacterium]|nr:helix-turn-helix transcriptional regulator [Bacteroidales bacterium]